MTLLARRLAQAEFSPRIFSWPSVAAGFSDNCASLAQFARSVQRGEPHAGLGPRRRGDSSPREESPVVHFVGHSLGGVLVLAVLEATPGLRRGRVVTLGSPHGGAELARRAARYAALRRLMGRTVPEALSRPPAAFPCEVGTVSGTLRAGFGNFFPGLPRPNDGSLSVAETTLPWATDRIVLPVSHTGMLVSPRVAEATVQFLRHGRFAKAPRPQG